MASIFQKMLHGFRGGRWVLAALLALPVLGRAQSAGNLDVSSLPSLEIDAAGNYSYAGTDPTRGTYFGTFGTIVGGDPTQIYFVTINVTANMRADCSGTDRVYLFLDSDLGTEQSVVDGDLVDPTERETMNVDSGSVTFTVSPGTTVYLEYDSTDLQTTAWAQITGVTVDGSCDCTDCSDAGDGSGSNGSVDVDIKLGHNTPNGPGGSIKMHVLDEQGGKDLYDPKMLSLENLPSQDRIYDAKGALRQIITDQSFVDVVRSPKTESYQLLFYQLSQVSGGPDQSGFYTPTGTPTSTWTFANVDDSPGTELRVTCDKDGTQTNYDYVWSAEPVPGNRGWTLTTTSGGQTLRTEQYFHYYSKPAGSITPLKTGESRTILNADGSIASEVSKTYLRINGIPLVASETDGLHSVNPRTTTYQYWDDPAIANNYLKPKIVTDPTGHWVYYNAYDAQGHATQRTEQYQNNRFSGVWPDPQNENFEKTRDDRNPAQIIVMNTERHGLTLVKKQWHLYEPWGAANPDDSNNLRKITDVTVTKASTQSWADPTNIVTVTYLYDQDDAATGKRKNAKFLTVKDTGTGDIFQYAQDADTGDVTTMTTSGRLITAPTEANPYAAAIDKGTVTTALTDQFNHPLSTTTVNVDGASRQTIADEVATQFDEAGRPTTVSYFGGKYTEQTTYACCGISSHTDQFGLQTNYAYDGLKRLTAVNKAGLLTQYQYDAANHQTAVLTGPVDSPIVQGQRQYDSNGELMWTKDALGRQTTFNTTVDADGLVVTTTTNPDGSTKIEKSYPDKSPYQITGTAVSAVQYDYSVDPDGNRIITQTPLDAGNAPLPNAAVQTYSDVAGREWKRIGPSPSGVGTVVTQSYYDDSGVNPQSKGQLVRVSQTGRPDSLFEYNALGKQSATSTGGSLTGAGGSAALSENDITYTMFTPPEGGDPVLVRQTTKAEWITGNTSQAMVSRTTMDGLRSWVTYDGHTNTITATPDTANSTVTRTTVFADGARAVSQSKNGQVGNYTRYSPSGQQLTQETSTYDAYGRLASKTDAGSGTTIYTYDDAGRVIALNRAASNTETTTYGDSARFGGRKVTVTKSGGATQVAEYYPNGLLALSYGDGAYPSQYTYDGAGRMSTLTTWAAFDSSTGVGSGTPSVTTWTYNDAGALLAKTYPDGSGPTYTYYDNGQLKTRTWARKVNGTAPLTTSYTYDPVTGALASVTYSDGTPGVTYSNFDRRGRPGRVQDGAGTRSITYAHSQTIDENYTDGLLAGFDLTRTLDASYKMGELAVTQQGVNVYDVNYLWSNAGRLTQVTWGNDVAAYTYQPNSALVANITYSDSGVAQMTRTQGYDQLKGLTQITSAASGGNIGADYQYNSRREVAQATQDDGSYWTYGYDDMGEVASGSRHFADGTTIPGLDFAYSYDSMGNRLNTATNGRPANYYAGPSASSAPGGNSLNQYGSRDVPRSLDVLGTAAPAATITVNGQIASRGAQYWYDMLTFNGSNSAQWVTVNVQGLLASTAASNGGIPQAEPGGHLFLAAQPESFAYDADGNLLSDGRWNYSWDGENRLVQLVTNDAAVAAGAPKVKITYLYDSQNRRLGKQVYAWNATSGDWTISASTAFLYDGWNLVAEINLLPAAPTLTHSYVWGTDISGKLQDAGGVGGLLMADLSNTAGVAKRVYYAYDATGSVSGLVEAATGNIVARYDYDPFGSLVTISGVAARDNPFRFSAKYWESETGFGYYGNRYYNPNLGRWLNPDPIAEMGGVNRYAVASNDLLNMTDPTGLYHLDFQEDKGQTGFVDKVYATWWGGPITLMSTITDQNAPPLMVPSWGQGELGSEINIVVPDWSFDYTVYALSSYELWLPLYPSGYSETSNQYRGQYVSHVFGAPDDGDSAVVCAVTMHMYTEFDLYIDSDVVLDGGSTGTWSYMTNNLGGPASVGTTGNSLTSYATLNSDTIDTSPVVMNGVTELGTVYVGNGWTQTNGEVVTTYTVAEATVNFLNN